MKKRLENETDIIRKAAVLSVGLDDTDGVSLERIFHEFNAGARANPEWTLIACPTLDSASSVLRKASVPIVICEAGLLPGTWREVLHRISALPDPPLLIVSSRLADERLWAEALNLGAYDVLAKPFDGTEVTRSVGMAWQHWQERHELHADRTKQRMAASRT